MELPIAGFKAEIQEEVEKNNVVVVEAPTGSGKSTQVPQYMMELGYSVLTTQPRRIAARSVAQRVASERGITLGEQVGFQTAHEKVVSKDTTCTFVTDGLALVRELVGGGNKEKCLILDEVHEWNENMEVLVAWCKKLLDEGGMTFKVVVMSATMDSKAISKFFNEAPIISVPGRLYQIEEREGKGSLIDEILTLIREGRNTLVFQPGKGEIREVIAELNAQNNGKGVHAEVLELHGQLSPQDQAKCFKHYGRPKVVVATNVAQTSLTINDIDAVIDDGTEKRMEVINGIEGLYTRPISLKDSEQRKGRAGRTRPGIYINLCPVAQEENVYAEILRRRLDSTVLRLAIAGFDMEELHFFHQPEKEKISSAKGTLKQLGCLVDGNVTKIGTLVGKLPVSVRYGRMLVEASKYGVVDSVLTAVAVLEQGGITVPPPSKKFPQRPDWRRNFLNRSLGAVRTDGSFPVNEYTSDLLAHIKLWEMCKDWDKEQMKERGISLRNYFEAKRLRKLLVESIKNKINITDSNITDSGDSECVLKCVLAGSPNEVFYREYGVYKNSRSVLRELGTSSLIPPAPWVMGTPFDLDISSRFGPRVINLLTMASVVRPEWIMEAAPHRIERSESKPSYDKDKDRVVIKVSYSYEGATLHSDTKECVSDSECAKAMASFLAGTMHTTFKNVLNDNYKIVQDRKKYKSMGAADVEVPDLFEWYTIALDGHHSLATVEPDDIRLDPVPEKIKLAFPLSIEVCGKEYEIEITGDGPRITVDGETTPELLNFPQYVTLPNGNRVIVKIKVGHGLFPWSDQGEDVHEMLSKWDWRSYIESIEKTNIRKEYEYCEKGVHEVPAVTGPYYIGRNDYTLVMTKDRKEAEKVAKEVEKEAKVKVAKEVEKERVPKKKVFANNSLAEQLAKVNVNE